MKRETLSGKLSSPSGRGARGDGFLGQARFCHRSLGVNSPHPSPLPEGEGEHRRGAALVVVLIGMAVAMAIFFSALKMIAVQRQSVELQTRQIQAGWLAESAVERACARLSAEANYRGETWSIPATDLGGRDGATVAIRVDDLAGKPDRRAIRVEADYPAEPDQRARQSREVTVPLKGPKP